MSGDWGRSTPRADLRGVRPRNDYVDVTFHTDPTVKGVVLAPGQQLNGRLKVLRVFAAVAFHAGACGSSTATAPAHPSVNCMHLTRYLRVYPLRAHGDGDHQPAGWVAMGSIKCADGE
jgi:hypothetical protein